MFSRLIRYVLPILLILSLNVDGLKNQNAKKRTPKFLQESLRAQSEKQMSTYTALAVASSGESAASAPSPESKVQIEVIRKIEDTECPRKTKKGDKLVVNYIGYLPDGKEFDSSFRRGKPSTFELGAGSVLPAWDQGLNDMCIGEIRQLTTPADLSGIVGSSASSLTFKVELSEIVENQVSSDLNRDEL